MSGFGRWLNNTVKEAHERYAREEEDKLEAEAEKDNLYGHSMDDEDYNEYLDDLRKQFGLDNGSEPDYATQDTDCDSATAAHQRHNTNLRKIRANRQKTRHKINPHLQQNESQADDDEWIPFLKEQLFTGNLVG